MLRKILFVAAVAVVGGSLPMLAPPARADAPGECHAVTVDFVPAPDLQIVAWLEDSTGAYVDTAFITQATGSFGIGNRPGRFDFNSGPKWPYGRRVTTFPVWAHKHGVSFPEVDFQNGDDSGLSHPFSESSREAHYCRPLMMTEPAWDTGTCASQAFTDKGVLSGTATSNYPPRADVIRTAGTDSTDVDKYVAMNPFDAVSQATPEGDMAASFVWSTPGNVPDGNYVLVVEVSKEFDQNDTYSVTAYPPPDVAYAEYGEPYRGQPSVVYRVPIALSATDTSGTTASYAGYGDPLGVDGNLRPPDATISTTTPDSGAARLGLTTDGTTMYRVRAKSHVQFDAIAPAAATGLAATTDSGQTRVSFIAPGDDGTTGQIAGYDIRVSAVVPITTANFASMQRVPTPANLAAPGAEQDLQLENLLPDTDYFIGIEAVDDCHNTSPLATLSFHTFAASTEVDACFVATAAYGSIMAADVAMLRHFRDAALRHSVLGELFVESYYTFGPPVAHVVGESELLRATARDALAPLVDRVKTFVF